MEETKKHNHGLIRKKKLNFLSKLGQRISKAFSWSRPKCGEHEITKPHIEDLPVTSKSHDDLKMNDDNYKSKKKYGRLLSIPSKNDRCLSEGDLTRDENKFYSGDSSRMDRKHYDCNDNDATMVADSYDNVSENKRHFKNELALKLRNKNPSQSKKDNESESSKTPDSPPRNCNGISPTREVNESRTPYSLSSLSHSSNSLLSGNVANCATSDGESMSKYVIDYTDDIGIVVDLATPISKTTNAGFLDSTAARQKLAASRPRRARMKPTDIGRSTSAGDKLKDSSGFSPVLEKREKLEEICEEDCQSPLNLRTNVIDFLNIKTNAETGTSHLSNVSSSPSTDKDVKTNSLSDNSKLRSLSLKEKSSTSSPSSKTISTQPNGNKDYIEKSNLTKHISFMKKERDDDKKFDEVDSIMSKIRENKMKSEEEEQKKNIKPLVTLRPVNSTRISSIASKPDNEFSKIVLKRTSWAPSNFKNQIEFTHEIRPKDDQQTDIKTRINRYTPMNLSKPKELKTISDEKERTDSQTASSHISETMSSDKPKSQILEKI